jgi:methyl-accepting chemotaxis protein
MKALDVTTAEQALGLQNVNAAVNLMDETTQLNAAMVEESSEATRNLAEQSVDLNLMISSFVISARAVLGKSTNTKLLSKAANRS